MKSFVLAASSSLGVMLALAGCANSASTNSPANAHVPGGSLADCSGSACDIVCDGNAYDIDGDPANGCEAVDTDGAGYSMETARAFVLGNGPGGGGNPINFVDGTLYADHRVHSEAPSDRSQPNDDYYSLTAPDFGVGVQEAVRACLGVVNFPTDYLAEICMTNANASAFDGATCAQARGYDETEHGQNHSVCVSPPDGSTQGGPFYIRIRYFEGTITADKYALWMSN